MPPPIPAPQGASSCPSAVASFRDIIGDTWNILLMALEGLWGQVVPTTKKGDGEKEREETSLIGGLGAEGWTSCPTAPVLVDPQSCEHLSVTEGTSGLFTAQSALNNADLETLSRWEGIPL